VYQRGKVEFREELEVLIDARKGQQREIYKYLGQVHGGNFKKFLKNKMKSIRKDQYKKKASNKIKKDK